MAAGRRASASKIRNHADLASALAALGCDSIPGTNAPITDHTADALITAAWLRQNAHRADLWHPAALTPAIAKTEGWTFGVL